VHLAVFASKAAVKGDDLGYHQFDHAARVRKGGIENSHAVLAGGAEVDLVGADAKSPDRQQVRCCLEGLGRDVGIAPDTHYVDLAQTSQQVGL
jgi:hypothetical protein